jgi:hypothetical protein
MNKLDICNAALLRCGAERIASLLDDSKRAVVVTGQYDITLAELLNDSSWNFATLRTTIDQESEEAVFGFRYKYLLPEKCVRVLELQNYVPFKVECDYIYSEQPTTINVKYVTSNVDPSKFSGAFVKAFYLKLAEDVSYLLVQSASLQNKIIEEAERYLRKARSMNSQEGTPDTRYPEGYSLGIRT